jgi:hypothetical protein
MFHEFAASTHDPAVVASQPLGTAHHAACPLRLGHPSVCAGERHGPAPSGECRFEPLWKFTCGGDGAIHWQAAKPMLIAVPVIFLAPVVATMSGGD